MDNKKTDQYYIQKIVTDIEFIIAHTAGLTIEQLEDNEVLVDSVMFRLIQVSENSDKLTESFKEQHKEFPWRAMKGLRNRIVHEYGNVDMSVVYDTIQNDIPELLQNLKEFI
ncbi:MAG: DUF86 domain-containing protein [Oscillospiraceae bacterium]|nr:DUF86 domain-containing protein [Oscillospiraceae bacterium]